MRRHFTSRLGLLASALIVSVLAGSVPATPERSAVTLVAQFTDAGAIIAGNDVAVDGVRAGKVDRIDLVDGKAHLWLRIDAAFTPVFADATAAVRPVSLLGERYVDLDRGTPSQPPLPDGEVIPAARTRRAVDVQDVLDAVDDPTGAALAAMIVAFGEGMDGRGEDAAAAMEALQPAFTRTAELLEILGGQNQLLAAMIDRTEPVVDALAAGRGERLDRLVAATDQMLGATGATRPELEEALRRLPTALETARGALAELSALAGETTPVLASLRPLTGDLRQIATELADFADAAGPALASLDPVLERGRELTDAARPVVAELAAAGGDVETVARSQRALIEAAPPDLSHLLDFIRNAALATAGRDGISHYLRIFSLIHTDRVDGFLPASPPAAAPPGASPAAPAPVPPGPAPLEPAAPGEPGSATGLTPVQERSLLNYLLGGR